MTIVKKCKWHKYKLNLKLPTCILLRKKNYYNPMTQSWNIYYQKTSKIAILSPFCKHCFSCSSLIPSKYLYVSTISVAKHSIKRVGLCFLRYFGNKIKDFLMNGSSFSPHLIISELPLRKISVTTTHA